MYQRRTSRHLRRTTQTRLSAPRALPPELLRRVEVDPVFEVMSQDHLTWFEPYTGKAVPASPGRVHAAREFLLENEAVWRNGQSTLPIAQLVYERWRHDLIRMLPTEARLRIFAKDGMWLDPYTGEFISGIAREEGKITFRTVSAIARHLTGSPAARTGRMLDTKAITELLRKAIARGAAPVLDDAMAKASTVQRQMLPELPSLAGFGLAVHYRAHHGVSGDFYDVITLPDGRIFFVIGDVSGHGMQAALVVATALKTLRFVARRPSSLIDLLARFNDEIKADLIPGQFITLVALALDEATGEIECVRAGHHPGLLGSLGGDTILRRVGRHGMAIGLAAGRPFVDTLREEHLQLQQGDIMLLYTDGLTEALKGEEAYGEARLYASMLTHLDRQPQAMVDAIAEDVSRWAGGPAGDDITQLTISADAVPARTPSDHGLTISTTVEAEQSAVAASEDSGADSASADISQPSDSGEIQAPAAT